MPADSFTHLHVASGWSLRHGASHPEQLVAVAAEHEMSALALTDRDGVAGAVRFAVACASAGIRPVLGVDLAVAPSSAPWSAPWSAPAVPVPAPTPAPTPVRGGVSVDHRLPRITVLARGRSGWAAVCRLVSAAHDAGRRGVPLVTAELVARFAATGDLVVLLGPGSDLGATVGSRRYDAASRVLADWRSVLPTESLVVEVVNHRGADLQGRSASSAARMLGFAHEHGVPVVVTNAVRYACRDDAPVADVLDAVRRLVPLDVRHVDRRTAEGYLKSGPQMLQVTAEIVRHSGAGNERRTVAGLLSTTRELAESCLLDPRDDLGIGSVHFPELSVVSPDDHAAGRHADTVLRERCDAGWGRRGLPRTGRSGAAVAERLATELDVIAGLGYATYFLTVGDVCDLIRSMQVRVAARGSGAGSLVNYLLGISGVDPMRHDLLFERFLSPLRAALPDIDVDVESARRTEIYTRIFERFGSERVACVSMADTYRVRHAVRDVGAALGLPPGEIDAMAKAFPHIRARDARAALRELPELRASGLARLADEPGSRIDRLFSLVEKLDGLPRHLALHPCGVVLSDVSLLDRTPVEPSALGFAMSPFDKDDVEQLGLLKLDVLGVRMQSAMAYALDEISRVEGPQVRPDLEAVPLDDPATFDLIRSTHTLGCFQIESPGQRELVGKFAPSTFDDLIIDISLFRPGPVKSDMVTPFLSARQGWSSPQYLHPDLEPALRPTYGVVVFHEQVLQILSTFTGCSLAQADERRRALGDPDGQAETREWFYPLALRRGYDLVMVERVWEVLRAFASFGFCKAHAAAFALPTYQSAWLKAHHPAAFLAGVLTHDPGMYPKRLILDDARQFGIAVLPLDVNVSGAQYRVERVAAHDEPPPRVLGQLVGDGTPRGVPDHPALPDARGYGIRLALADVKGITDDEVARIVAGRP
ncbi:MAG: DNA polymerase III subunit alpha, partial [Actinomycetes bacterium]